MSRISIWVGVRLSVVGSVPMRRVGVCLSAVGPVPMRSVGLVPMRPSPCTSLLPGPVPQGCLCRGLSPCGGELSRHFIGNCLRGNCLRLNVLAREDLGAQALADCKGNFLE